MAVGQAPCWHPQSKISFRDFGNNGKNVQAKRHGRARHSAASVVQFRGGGVVHGPVVRDHGHHLQKVRQLELRSAISSKVAEGKFLVIDKLTSGGKDGQNLEITRTTC